MFKKNSIKILLAISLALSTFYSNANAMKNNKNSINVNNLTELNTINESSKDKNKEDKKNRESNININLKKSQSEPNLKSYNIKTAEPNNKNEKLNTMPKFTFDISKINDINKINKKPEFKLNEHNDFINKIVEKELKEEKEENKKENSININIINENNNNTVKKSNNYKAMQEKIKGEILNKRKDLNKLINSNEEAKKLNDFYNYFDRKFKKIDKICKSVVNISRIYRNKNSKKDFTNIPPLEYTIIDHLEDARVLAREEGHEFETEYQKLHQKEIFDIDKNISNLEIYVGKLLDNIDMINQKYKEYLNFIENIKDKKLLNLNFVKDNFNNKIISDDNMFMKYVFDIDEMINKLKKHVGKILNSIKLTKDRTQLRKDFYIILDDCDMKKTNKSPIAEKIKREIEVIKEIIYFMIKVVESKVVNNIQDRVLGLVGEEQYVMMDKFFYDFNK